MLTLEELRKRFKPQILVVAARHGAENIRVFGSVARSEQDETSDVDLLYSMREGYGLWEACGMIYEMEKALPFKVDCAWDRQLRPEFRDAILSGAIPL